MSDKNDQRDGESGDHSSGELDAARKTSGRNEAESGEEVKAEGKSEGGEKESEGTRPKTNSKRQAVKGASKKGKKQKSDKATDGLTSGAEEEKAGGTEAAEPGRDGLGRFVPGEAGPDEDEAGETETGDGKKDKGDGKADNGNPSGTTVMTEAAQRRLVSKLLGRADTMAQNDQFKLNAADLIRLIQLQKEMTAKPHKVTVQWVEDEKE